MKKCDCEKKLKFWMERCNKLDKRIIALTKMNIKVSDEIFDEQKDKND